MFNISSALNNLDYNKFNRKLSVFDFYGLFYKEKQIG